MTKKYLIKTIVDYLKCNQLDKAIDLAFKLNLTDLVNDIGELIYSPDNEYQKMKGELIADLTEE